MEITDPRLKTLRPSLIQLAGAFVQEAVRIPGVKRVALVGSITTPKPNPKDVALLVTVEDTAELAAVGQVILGVLSAVYQGVSAVVQAAINVLNFLLKLVEDVLLTAWNLVIDGYNALLQAISAPFVVPLLSVLAGMDWNGTAVVSSTEYSGILTYMNLNPGGGPKNPESPSQGDNDLSNDFAVLTATIIGLEVGWGVANYVMDAMDGGTTTLGKASLTTLFKQAVVKSVPQAIETGVGYGVAIAASAFANDLSDSSVKSVVQGAGFSAGETIVAMQLYDDLRSLSLSKTYSGIVEKQQLGILISLPFGIFSDIFALVTNGVQGYAQANSDTHLHTAVFILSHLAVVLGAAGMFFTLSIAWKAIEQATNINPLGTALGLGLCVFGFGFGAYQAIHNPA